MTENRIHKNTFIILIALCMGWTLLYADRTALYPLLSVIGDEFNLSATHDGHYYKQLLPGTYLCKFPQACWLTNLGKNGF